jgi:hypothetical protein
LNTSTKRKRTEEEKTVILVTVFGSPRKDDARQSCLVDWWDEDQKRWREQAFFMPADVLMKRLAREYKDRKVRVEEGTPKP